MLLSINFAFSIQTKKYRLECINHERIKFSKWIEDYWILHNFKLFAYNKFKDFVKYKKKFLICLSIKIY